MNPSPTAASFVRPRRPADEPLSFLQALRQKYAPEDAAFVLSEEKPIDFSGKVVEEVGFEKVRLQQSALRELRVVVLDGLCVAGLDSGGLPLGPRGKKWQACVSQIAETCPKVRELDLSRSLIERWVDVVAICSALPELRRLVLRYALQLNTAVYVDKDTVAIAFTTSTSITSTLCKPRMHSKGSKS